MPNNEYPLFVTLSIGQTPVPSGPLCFVFQRPYEHTHKKLYIHVSMTNAKLQRLLFHKNNHTNTQEPFAGLLVFDQDKKQPLIFRI